VISPRCRRTGWRPPLPSTLAWLDFAESDRETALKVIDLFRDRTTVDELGFSPIRDALADAFFPGTSTIQTRARYFLFIPWIMKSVGRRSLPAPDLARRAAKLEDGLVKALQATGGQSGIIGRLAGDSLKRKPSSVYWRGLRLWGIRIFPGSIEQYFRSVSRDRGKRAHATDDGEPATDPLLNWHPSLPAEPADFRSVTTFALTVEEAEFLRDRIQCSHPRSLLAWLLGQADELSAVDYIWDHPLAASMPRDLRNAVAHAEAFSTCIWGAAILYGFRIAQLKQADALVAGLGDRLESWIAHMDEHQERLGRWNRAEFWAMVRQFNPRLPLRTQQFAEHWIALVLEKPLSSKRLLSADVLSLLAKREAQIKGSRARLRADNQRGRDLWNGSADIQAIDFRWRPAQIILNDILFGLGRTAEAQDA
jgi:hypothetical protein